MKKDCGQQWWKDAKYGLFIHWGLYSHLAGEWRGRRTASLGEWIMKHFLIPVKEYEQIAKEFNPTGFDAEEWVALAKDAGMRYIVITSKHHDGFAMYHSKCDPYNIVDATPFGRDPIKELAVACEKAGIKLCFYYSQAQDWHHPNAYGYDQSKSGEVNDFRKYVEEKCKPQLKELLTEYGDVGLIWFDTPQTMPIEDSKAIKDYVKSLQPNCIVSGRIGNQLGEYISTGDNRIPLLPYDGDWEVPATLNDTWGYKSWDENWKDPANVLRLMLKINGRGGNYLLNVGPDGRGVIPAGSADILRRVGAFVRENGDAIYATKPVWGYAYDLEQEQMYLTARDNHLYLSFFKIPETRTLHFELLASEIREAKLLATGQKLEFTQTRNNLSKNFGLRVRLPEEGALPERVAYTIDLELADAVPEFNSLDNL
ncbi:MAG: alpha-L-fucosidase [Clostridiales bacterium]|jgi:alpha-L-fucosidase|nr:alpha-L-fucosidase [Clostridiales bacterium]